MRTLITALALSLTACGGRFPLADVLDVVQGLACKVCAYQAGAPAPCTPPPPDEEPAP